MLGLAVVLLGVASFWPFRAASIVLDPLVVLLLLRWGRGIRPALAAMVELQISGLDPQDETPCQIVGSSHILMTML
jgi:hypothetical protein